MAEFPRTAEGRGVIELFPGVFWTDFPGSNDSRGDGERASYWDFLEAASDIGLTHVAAAKAFDGLYDNLHGSAQSIIEGVMKNSYEAWRELASWQLEAQNGYWFNAMGNPESRRRTRRQLLLGTQAAYASYTEHVDQQPTHKPALKQFHVIGHLLGLDEAEAFENEADAIQRQIAPPTGE